MRKFRIFLSSVMLIASLLWLGFGSYAPRVTEISELAQIIPSAIRSCLATTVLWLIATLLFGRIYCATVCPVGTLQDMVIAGRRASSKKIRFTYEQPKSIRFVILAVYLISLAVGVLATGFLIEPWNMMRNVMSAIHPADTLTTWQAIGLSTGIGVAAGAIGIGAILILAWLKGKDFCTMVCPLGTAMGCLHTQTLMHIAIDPDKCISCMKCEEACSTKCIKVADRHVDNSRCVRCFDCISVCPNEAIRFQINRDRSRQTPLLEPNN